MTMEVGSGVEKIGYAAEALLMLPPNPPPPVVASDRDWSSDSSVQLSDQSDSSHSSADSRFRVAGRQRSG